MVNHLLGNTAKRHSVNKGHPDMTRYTFMQIGSPVWNVLNWKVKFGLTLKGHSYFFLTFFFTDLFYSDLTFISYNLSSPLLISSFIQPGTFPYKEDIMSTNNVCLVFAVLLFIGCILSFKVSLHSFCVTTDSPSFTFTCLSETEQMRSN